MNKRIPICIGLLLLAFAVWAQVTPMSWVRQLILRLDNIAYDMQLRSKLLTHLTKKPSSPVVIVDIDNKSLKAEGRWPWPRAKLATLIQRLKEDGVVVVTMDVMFAEQETDIADAVLQILNQKKLNTPTINNVLKKIQPELNNDTLFAAALAKQDSVLGMTFLPTSETTGMLSGAVLILNKTDQADLNLIGAEGYIANIPILQTAAKYAGFMNVYPDSDGIIRHVPLLMRYQDKLYPSLALAAVKLYLLADVSLDAPLYNDVPQLEAIKLGGHIIPTDRSGQMWIPFRGKSFTFPYFSATDVLNKKTPTNALTGKIVFLGTSATGVGDLRATAVQSVFPGVEIQATIADGILKDNYFYKPAWTKGAEMAITVLLGILFAFLFPYLGPRTLALLVIFIPLFLTFLNNILWLQTGLIIFMLVPIVLSVLLAVMNMMYGYLFETRKREQLKEIFGQYVPEEHIDEMLKTSGNYSMRGEDREMTVLFVDIRNFTGISESMTANELKDLLNKFFTAMTEVVFKYKGTVDKYIGDLMMAFWGAPLKDKRHTEHAIAAALDMQVAVEKLKPIFAKFGGAEINVGVGLNSGVMSVGDMGSHFRRSYTVLGDTVNLASRIEGLTKYYNVKIITTENTQKNQKKFVFRQLDRVKVKGKKVAVTIYEIVCRKIPGTEELQTEINVSDQALNYYFNQQWDTAEKLFNELHTAHPETKLYHLYLKRITEFKLIPPPSNWDGVFVHTTK